MPATQLCGYQNEIYNVINDRKCGSRARANVELKRNKQRQQDLLINSRQAGRQAENVQLLRVVYAFDATHFVLRARNFFSATGAIL